VRISELSRSSGVSVATIKFYLRDGVLHDGLRTSATQASYDDSHVARLRMVRALVGVGGMSLARVKAIIAVIEDPPATMHELLGPASLMGRAGDIVCDEPEDADDSDPEATGHARVHRLLREWGWDPAESFCGTHIEMADALDAIEASGLALSDLALDDYRDHLSALAAEEVARTPTTSSEAAVRYVALGVPLVEPLLLAIRRLGHQRASAAIFGAAAAPDRANRVTPAPETTDERVSGGQRAM